MSAEIVPTREESNPDGAPEESFDVAPPYVASD